MKAQAEEPLFTTKGLLLGGIFFSIYAAILFSMDPAWVMWAAPMAMGALYVPDPPPPLFAHPEDAFQMSFVASLVSLLALAVVTVVRGEVPFRLFLWLNARWRERFAGGVAASSRDVSGEEEMLSYNCAPPTQADECGAPLPESRRDVSGDLGDRSPEDRQSL